MKKGIITFIVALSTVCGAWAGTPSKIIGIARQYDHCEGFEVVSLGRLALGGIKGIVRLSSDLDKDERRALAAFNGVNRITIVDFEDASEADRTRFCKKVEKALSKLELIMEVKDSSETIRIYGIEDGKRLKDVVLLGTDGLISVAGSINFDNLGDLMEMSK